MRKLYQRINGVLHYHEAWAGGGVITEHWGVAGEKGETSTHHLKIDEDGDAAIDEVLKSAVANGYISVDEIGEVTLLIEYAVIGFGTSRDLEKRHALEDRMNETLGWTGLGICDGGSIGSGTMDVYCYVADFELAKRVIEADLAGTEFGDYSRICRKASPPGTPVDDEV